ncbi:Malate/L-lactate dehydrogenase [Neurospora tetrasperma FGSC 2509]|nr:Malate/L-lactate dehydrogenase [Neurospora tetrasperma FGSC 2509]
MATASTTETPNLVRVNHHNAKTFAAALLTASGVSAKNAEITASGLVQADLRGVESHGILRLPSYLSRVRSGVLDPAAEPELKQITPVVAQIDARNGFGFPAAHLGMDTAIKMAGVYGIGMQAVDADMMSLVFTNSSPALPVWGSKEKMMGVSPIACGAPGGKGEGSKPFILDMAPSVAARGKIYKALRRGEKIPTDWALDGEGKQTDDPAKALEGVMLPMGGPKGSALAIMMDVFSGVLSGSAFAGGVTGPYDMSKPGDVGHFFVAIKPDLFMSLDEFRERMDVLYQKAVDSEKMHGVDRIYFPGEIEQLNEEQRLKDGIPYAKAEIDALNAEAEKLGLGKIPLIE